MKEIVLIIGIAAYGLFAIQFLLSLLGFDSDFDVDIDFDGDADFSFSDLVSFKGFLHLIMGMCTYLYPQLYLGNPITIYTWIIALIIGIVFVIGLYYVYKSCIKLQHTPKREEDLSDRLVTIHRHERELTYIGSATMNGAYEEFVVESSKPLTVGKQYKISKFKNNKIYI